MNRTKKFPVRKDIEEIKTDIRRAGEMYANQVRKIFFEDGNAFVVKSEVLIELTEYCHQKHPNLKKVSSYAHAKDIIKKSNYLSLKGELARDKEKFLKIVEAGINDPTIRRPEYRRRL